MTDSSWPRIHETAIIIAECDRAHRGNSVYNMEHFFQFGGAKVGATMQEGRWVQVGE